MAGDGSPDLAETKWCMLNIMTGMLKRMGAVAVRKLKVKLCRSGLLTAQNHMWKSVDMTAVIVKTNLMMDKNGKERKL